MYQNNPYQNQPQFGNQYELRILSLRLIETGTYNEMYLRPYETVASQDNVSRLAEQVLMVTHEQQAKQNQRPVQVNTIVPESIAGTCVGIVSPSATIQGPAKIPNGWGEKRIRFILEVSSRPQVGGNLIYYFQGYTSFNGVTNQGAIAEDMLFIINSYIVVDRSTVNTPYGIREVDRVVGSNQLITDSFYKGIESPDKLYILRPTDIYDGITKNHIYNAMSGLTNGQTMYDGSIVVGNIGKTSSRSNNTPPEYLAKLLSSYNASVREAHYDARFSENHLTLGRQMVVEDNPTHNPFLKRLGDVHNRQYVTNFYIGDLRSIDYNVDNVTDYVLRGPAQRAQVHMAGSSEYWQGADYPTVAASILANSVPAIMLDVLLTRLVFGSTNNDLGGRVTTTIIDGKSVVNADLSENYQRFIHKFNSLVIPDITFRGEQLYIFGDTIIDIAIGGYPKTRYVVPSFCDHLIAPVTCSQPAHCLQMTNDMEYMTTMFNSMIGGNTPNYRNIQPI